MKKQDDRGRGSDAERQGGRTGSAGDRSAPNAELKQLRYFYDCYVIAEINRSIEEMGPEEFFRLQKRERENLIKIFPDFRDRDWGRGMFQRWLIVEVKKRLRNQLRLPSFEEWMRARGTPLDPDTVLPEDLENGAEPATAKAEKKAPAPKAADESRVAKPEISRDGRKKTELPERPSVESIAPQSANVEPAAEPEPEPEPLAASSELEPVRESESEPDIALAPELLSELDEDEEDEAAGESEPIEQVVAVEPDLEDEIEDADDDGMADLVGDMFWDWEEDLGDMSDGPYLSGDELDERIILLLAHHPEGLTLTDVAEMLGRTRQSLIRPINRLYGAGKLAKDGKRWLLG